MLFFFKEKILDQLAASWTQNRMLIMYVSKWSVPESDCIWKEAVMESGEFYAHWFAGGKTFKYVVVIESRFLPMSISPKWTMYYSLFIIGCSLLAEVARTDSDLGIGWSYSVSRSTSFAGFPFQVLKDPSMQTYCHLGCGQWWFLMQSLPEVSLQCPWKWCC